MSYPHLTASRLGDVRSSTPGRGERQWTNVPNDNRLGASGAPWQVCGGPDRNPIPAEPALLSDVARRDLGRVNVSRNAQTYGTSADAEYEAQQRRDALMRERRAEQEGRLLKMVSSKADYHEAVRLEQSAALSKQIQAQAEQQRTDARREFVLVQEGVRCEHAQEAVLQQQQSARRTMAQQVAAEQLAQMQARKSMTLGEREAEKAKAREEVETGTHWEARFGRSLR